MESVCYNSPLLKFASTRTKVLSRSQRLEDGAGGVNARERDVVTTPVDLDVLLLQSKEDH